MNSLAELAARTERLATGFSTLPASLVKATADVVEKSIGQQIGQDAPRRRVAGGSVGVRQTTIRTGSNPAILMRARGPLHLLANSTRRHPITARPPGSRRQHRPDPTAAITANAVALRTPYGPRYRVNHPGTHGKNTWHKGIDQARPLVNAGMQAAVATELRKALR